MGARNYKNHTAISGPFEEKAFPWFARSFQKPITNSPWAFIALRPLAPWNFSALSSNTALPQTHSTAFQSKRRVHCGDEQENWYTKYNDQQVVFPDRPFWPLARRIIRIGSCMESHDKNTNLRLLQGIVTNTEVKISCFCRNGALRGLILV
jgi:hypothetical protein